MKRILCVMALLMATSPAFAEAPTRKFVTAIEVRDKATMYAKHRVHLGFSCRTGPEGEMPNLKQARLGDTVFVGKYSFKVGVIEAITFSEDLKTTSGVVLAQKGDTQCVLAANEKSLPYDKKRCDEVWMFIPKCKVIE